jgi:hypothetical protein
MRAIILLFLIFSVSVLAIMPVTGADSSSSQPPVTISCTPPPCTVDSYTCPEEAGECPGGCGMVCAEELRVTTPAPTYTTFCTPPPCAVDKYACPEGAGGCPGGCGMVCAETTQSAGIESVLVVMGMVTAILLIGRRSP